MRLFVKGDIDGFFGLALDNLVQVLLIAAALSLSGLMHGYSFEQSDTVMKLSPDIQFFIAYSAMALIFISAKWITRKDKEEVP